MKKVLVLALSLFLVLFSLPVQATNTNASNTMFTVAFTGDHVSPDVINQIEQAGGTIVATYEKVGALQFRGPSSLMKSLKGIKSVQAVSPSFMLQLPKASMVEFNDTQAVSTEDAAVDEM